MFLMLYRSRVFNSNLDLVSPQETKCMFKVNDKPSKRFEISQGRRSGVFIVSFGHISHFFVVFQLWL